MNIKYVQRIASIAQINWGGHDDPNGLLNPGTEYELEGVYEHSSYTTIHLKEFPGKKFNSVWFDMNTINKKR